MLYRTTSVVAGENAAPNLFANLFLKQDGEPAEATNLGINAQDRPWRRVADEMHNFYQRSGPNARC